jgi:hypothetical protein
MKNVCLSVVFFLLLAVVLAPVTVAKSRLRSLMDRSHDITTHPLTQRDPSHHCTIVLTFLRLRILLNCVEAWLVLVSMN